VVSFLQSGRESVSNCDSATGCARVEAIGLSADESIDTFHRLGQGRLPGTGAGDWILKMAGKNKAPTVEQISRALEAHSFTVSKAKGAAGALLVSKHGCAAVLEPALGTTVDTAGSVVAYRERPGALVGGEISRLLDRGYQKFLKNSKYELPATATQLQAIHQFTEELTQATGGISLYNESLGTTSDLYQYDRVKGREVPGPAAPRPWELKEGH
jgi:hypothetical protein